MSALGIAIIGLACFLAGLGIAYWFIRTDSDINAQKAESLRDEFASYKSDVNQHFAETARHFQSIGEQYRALYVHMAEGAENLLGLEGEEAQRQFPLIAPAAAAAAAQAAESAAEDTGEVIESEALEAEDQPEVDESVQAIADGEISAEADEEAPDTEVAEAESTLENTGEDAAEDTAEDTAEMEALDEDAPPKSEADTETDEDAETDAEKASATVHVLHKSEDAA